MSISSIYLLTLVTNINQSNFFFRISGDFGPESTVPQEEDLLISEVIEILLIFTFIWHQRHVQFESAETELCTWKKFFSQDFTTPVFLFGHFEAFFEAFERFTRIDTGFDNCGEVGTGGTDH